MKQAVLSSTLLFTALNMFMLDCVLVAQAVPGSREVDDADSYAVYRALLPSEWLVSYARAKKLVLQRETTTQSGCAPSGAALETDWHDIVANFKAHNATARRIVEGRDIGLPYVVVATAEIEAFFKAKPSNPLAGWTTFQRRFPDSHGYIQVSAVGFDNSRDRAMVYMAHHCGGLCGVGIYHFLNKVNGAWVETTPPGVSKCGWES